MARLAASMIVATLCGCGGGGAQDAASASDSPPGDDAPTAIDAAVDSPPGTPDAPGPDAAIAACTPTSGSTVVTRLIAVVNDFPVLVTSPPGSDGRMFVVERSGVIEIIENETLLPTPFVDLSDNAGGPVFAGFEQGLLGLAFHPGYAANRKFYVAYTTADANVVAEYQTRADDPYRADPTTARVLLSIPDFAVNHNAGMMQFGPGGYLYITTGDGGGMDDPQNNGQNKNRLLGKMLRIDVDHPGGGREYGIPADNPYAGGGGAPEVFMYGLRNPFRFSFDAATDDIYIGDVGQRETEEIDVVAFADAPGADFGWDNCEGTHPHEGGTGCDSPTQPNRHEPVFEQVRPEGGGTSLFQAIIGGQVYRSTCYPDLVGRYFFTDYYQGGLWSFRYEGGVATDIVEHPGPFPIHPTSIHRDAFGELYVSHGSGAIRHIEVQ